MRNHDPGGSVLEQLLTVRTSTSISEDYGIGCTLFSDGAGGEHHDGKG